MLHRMLAEEELHAHMQAGSGNGQTRMNPDEHTAPPYLKFAVDRGWGLV
jgi:hypothetical protein